MNTRRTWRMLVPVIALMCMLLAACGSETAATVNDSTRQSSVSDRPLAGDYTISTGPDSSFSSVDHAGDIVVLYFSFPG